MSPFFAYISTTNGTIFTQTHTHAPLVVLYWNSQKEQQKNVFNQKIPRFVVVTLLTISNRHNMNNNNIASTSNDVNDVVEQPNLAGIPITNPRIKKCGFCGQPGHNKRTCPRLTAIGTFFAVFPICFVYGLDRP